MKRFFFLFFFVLLGCSPSSDFEGAEVSIEYIGIVNEGDWIQVDRWRLYHMDVAEFLSDTSYLSLDSVEVVNKIEEFESDFYLPTTIENFYHPGFNKQVTRENDKLRMAYLLKVQLIRKISHESEYGVDNFPYDFGSNAELHMRGIFKIRSKNGNNIKVSTSPNYKANIKVLD